VVDGSSQTERNFPILLLTVVEAIEVNRDAHGKQQKVISDFVGFFFQSLFIKSHKNRKTSPTIHHKYKYSLSAVQTVEDRRQKGICSLL